jgi:hypothetical protein
MHHFVRLLAVCALVAGGALLGVTAATNGRTAARNHPDVPVAEFEATIVDLGVIAAGPAAQGVFPVRNRGGRRLVITPVGCSGCGKPASAGPPVIVPPGDEGEVIVPLHTADRHGPVQHLAHYSSSDPKYPMITLTIRAEVRR